MNPVSSRIFNIPLTIALVLLTGSCALVGEIDDAARSYRSNHDYASLKTIADHLVKGMSKQEVEKLLGLPEEGPSSGIFIYWSDRDEYMEEVNRKVNVALVVYYFPLMGEVTSTLDRWHLGPISE